MSEVRRQTPDSSFSGQRRNGPKDFLAGFLVFLIALPLCLGISLACGYPPIAGIFTAIIGGLLSGFISNSELTIKGPAAGLIVIAIGCILDFGGANVFSQLNPESLHAYRLALGVGVAAGVIQIILALVRAGVFGNFFPTSVVRGMLAAIGVIIIAKQFPVVMGTDGKGHPLELLLAIPDKIRNMNPEIALIGVVSLLILFGLPFIKNKYVKRIPAPMVVVLVAVPLALFFDLAHEHTYTFGHSPYKVGEMYLVSVPSNMFAAIAFPDFSALQTAKGWYWVMMFCLIGSLESILSAKAIDTQDPWGRRTNLDRDLLAIGICNTLSALVGGLPMISEIVRSKANIDNGARTRFANAYHGLFLLLFVALVPFWIHRIPLAALAAMLVYTGFRLASPKEFAHVYSIGKEQFLIFVTTVIAVLATDLLMGVLIGIAVKLLIHLINGAPLPSLFLPKITVEQPDEKTYRVKVQSSAVFSNWLLLNHKLTMLDHGRNVVLDLSETRLVDHTVMEKLDELQKEYQTHNRSLEVVGLHEHRAFSGHPHAARKKGRGKTVAPVRVGS